MTQGNGLSGQESNCRGYAQQHDLEVIATFKDEGVSGGLLERKGIQELFTFVELYNASQDTPIEVFLCEDIDRLARDITIHYQLREELEKRNLDLQMVKMHFEATAVGKFNEGIMALTAEFYRLQNKERVISRQMARLQDGYWNRGAPTGYQYQKAPSGGKVMVPIEPMAKVIRQGMVNFADGKLDTLADLARFWENAGVNLTTRKKRTT